MNYPSIITSFPQPTATSRLNSPSHSALENLQSSTIAQIEAVIGLSGDSSTLGTLIGDLRSPDSNGGGHVQTANKGGTGQTSYAKGDILVAQSPSVLTKLAVSSVNGYVLIADSNSPVGISYAPVVSNKIVVKSSFVSYARGAASIVNVLFSASILGSTLGSNNAIRFTGEIENLQTNGGVGDTFTWTVNYGNNSIMNYTQAAASIIQSGGPISGGTINGVIIGNNSSSVQQGYLNINISNNVISPLIFGISSVNSDANQNLVVTGQFNSASTGNSVAGRIFIVEKIA